MQARDERRLRIRQHQRVFFHRLLEEVEDTLFLEQPGNEIQVAFAILHGVFPGRQRSLNVEPEIGEAAIRKNLFHNLLRILVLENTAIGEQRKEPDPGYDFGLVRHQAVFAAFHLRNAADVSVNVPLVSVGQGDRQNDRLFQQCLQIQRRILRKHFDHIVERPRYGFVALKAFEQQDIVAQRGFDTVRPV